jgi:hypothetical protein
MMSDAKDDTMSDDPRPETAATPEAVAPAAPPRTRPAPVVPAPAAVAPDPKAQQKVRFDSANIKSTYCNVCNATSTREEVVINFGVNKTWDQGGQDLEVQLEHRIILSPFAAKRLQDLLVRLIAEHEQRYGKLN